MIWSILTPGVYVRDMEEPINCIDMIKLIFCSYMAHQAHIPTSCSNLAFQRLGVRPSVRIRETPSGDRTHLKSQQA